MSEKTENGNNNGERRKAIKLRLPGGAEIEIRGYDIILLIVVAGISLGSWFMYILIEDHKEMKQAFAEIIYILTLDPEERKALKITMPESLRKRVAR